VFVFGALPPPPPRYGFATPSTLKPTQWSYPLGSINQIPGQATICGDVRVTPFYDMAEVGQGLGWCVEPGRARGRGRYRRVCRWLLWVHRMHAVCTHMLLQHNDAPSAEVTRHHMYDLMTLLLAGDDLQLISTAAAGHVQDPGVCG
jgi:hypothetical protein